MSYYRGQHAALVAYKLAFPAATDPTVQSSGVLQSAKSPGLSNNATQNMTPPTSPFDVSQLFSVHEQSKSRTEPVRKLSSDMCTSCRKDKHYGPCSKPRPIKRADFNMNMYGSDPSGNNGPATGQSYHSAVSNVSSMGQAMTGRPADEQAASGFADFFRGNGINGMADQPGRMYGGLNTSSKAAADFFTNMPGAATHSMHEAKGPSTNPYEERLTRLTPPVGWGDEGDQRVNRAFGQIDNVADTTNVGGGFGDPAGGPAVLG